tara:strand:- start:488 stop:904 length:417 start_codon:yes stop_codon:yes gene_type:complete
MATTTFTNATGASASDEHYYAVAIAGITASEVTNMRFEIDWNPDEDCGGDATSSVCSIYDPTSQAGWSNGDKEGGEARTDVFNKTSGFTGSFTFNGDWTFYLVDDDYTSCYTISEARIIVTHGAAATPTSPAFSMFVD